TAFAGPPGRCRSRQSAVLRKCEARSTKLRNKAVVESSFGISDLFRVSIFVLRIFGQCPPLQRKSTCKANSLRREKRNCMGTGGLQQGRRFRRQKPGRGVQTKMQNKRSCVGCPAVKSDDRSHFF